MTSAGARSQSSASPDLTTREGAAPFASTWRRQHLTVEERIARGTYRIASYWVTLSAGPIAYGLFRIRYRNRPGESPGGELAGAG